MSNFEANYLKHYASKYYDPQEAHEYYEKHKQLKGRKKASTASLNEQGKSAAAYVKEKIDAEKEEYLAQEQLAKEQYQAELREVKQRTMEQHTKAMTAKIGSLKKLLSRMSPAEKRKNAPKIKAMIAKLRDENNAKRQAIDEQFKAVNVEVSEQSKANKDAIRDHSSNAYQEELEKMNKESGWQKPAKTSKRSRRRH